MRIIDITRPVFENMTVWPGDGGVLIERTGSINGEDVANTSRISIGVHTGTHVDAPLHFIDGGKSIDQLDINLITGTVTVIDTGNERRITRRLISDILADDCKAVFFKTLYSNIPLTGSFDTDYPDLEPDAAEFLTETGVRVVGIDTLSVERYDSRGFTVHKTLLSREVLIVEGLCLKGVTAGKYEYICMPMLIKGSDGAPARVVLIQPDTVL